jgi:sec-independent protein translocase protein TatC
MTNPPAPHEPEPVPEEAKVLSFTEHLEELRWRILITLGFFAVCFLASFFVAPKVIEVLIAPLTRIERLRAENTLSLDVRPDRVLVLGQNRDQSLSSTLANLGTAGRIDALSVRVDGHEVVVPLGSKSQTSLFFLSPIEPFVLLVKGALLLSVFLTIPLGLQQLWLFVAPGLLQNERRIIRPILLASLVLFAFGVAFAYGISHAMLRILLGFSDYIPGLQPNIVASEYLSFMLTLMLGFGLVFEFPLVLILLSRLGIITSRFLVERRKYAILVIAVASAAITPTPDAFNMLLMMAPLLILYELSIWIIRLLEKRSAAA